MKINTWTIGFGVLLIGALLVIGFSGDKGALQGKEDLLFPVTEADNIKGAEQPKIFLVEYSDFECPACAAYAPVLSNLAEEFSNDLGIVYRHFPLRSIHPNADIAGRAAEAAGIQGKFFEMHDVLFANQEAWAKSSSALNLFASYAEAIGLNVNQFLIDIESDQVKERVLNGEKEALSMSIAGTPTFYLNGKIIRNPGSYEAFRDLIQAELTTTE